MLAVEKAHPIKLLMFGEGLEYVKAVLKKNIPDIIFLQKMVQRLYRMGSQPAL